VKHFTSDLSEAVGFSLALDGIEMLLEDDKVRLGGLHDFMGLTRGSQMAGFIICFESLLVTLLEDNDELRDLLTELVPVMRREADETVKAAS